MATKLKPESEYITFHDVCKVTEAAQLLSRPASDPKETGKAIKAAKAVFAKAVVLKRAT